MNLSMYNITSTQSDPETRALVDRLNGLVTSRAASLFPDKVQALLDAEVSAEIRERYGLKVGKVDFQMEPDE